MRRWIPWLVIAITITLANRSSAVDLSNAWYNLQWPPTMVVNAFTPTDMIYGQIWVGGLTPGPGPAAGIRAQVGYGPSLVAPGDPSWVWTEMTYNVDVGNNDEYMGNFVAPNPGTYAYTTRFSGDDGLSWNYTDLNGPPYEAANAGVMTVIPEPALLPLAGLMLLMVRRRRR